MIIKNGSVFQEDKSFAKKDLYIENGMIVNGPDEVTDKTEVDAEGLLVLPGLMTLSTRTATSCLRSSSTASPSGTTAKAPSCPTL